MPTDTSEKGLESLIVAALTGQTGAAQPGSAQPGSVGEPAPVWAGGGYVPETGEEEGDGEEAWAEEEGGEGEEMEEEG